MTVRDSSPRLKSIEPSCCSRRERAMLASPEMLAADRAGPRPRGPSRHARAGPQARGRGARAWVAQVLRRLGPRTVAPTPPRRRPGYVPVRRGARLQPAPPLRRTRLELRATARPRARCAARRLEIPLRVVHAPRASTRELSRTADPELHLTPGPGSTAAAGPATLPDRRR